jgi:glycosyltransferase involved in cell wall biosynthesis
VGPFLDAALATGARVIVDADESLPKVAWGTVGSRYSSIRHRMRAFIEVVFVLGRMERASYPRATEVWVASDLECAAFSSFVDPARLRVVPNVVEVPKAEPQAGPVTALAFVGSYFYPPNEAAALELIDSIAPAVRKRGGPRIVMLVGPAVTPRLAAAAARDPGVRLLGEVPDVRAPLREAGVLVVPVRSGGGTRVKIIESMAAGVPVVSTSLGIEGIAVQDGDQVLVAETPSRFADQLLRLESEIGLRAGLVQRAFEFVSQEHSPGALREALWRDPPIGALRSARG